MVVIEDAKRVPHLGGKRPAPLWVSASGVLHIDRVGDHVSPLVKGSWHCRQPRPRVARNKPANGRGVMSRSQEHQSRWISLLAREAVDRANRTGSGQSRSKGLMPLR